MWGRQLKLCWLRRERDQQFGIQVLPQGIQTSPIQLFWCLRCCSWHHTTFRGRCFAQFLGAPIHSLKHLLPDPAATLHHWMPGAGMDFPEVHIHSTSHCDGSWASWQLVHLPALCWGPGCLVYPAAGKGESETASTEPKLFLLSWPCPQRPGHLIKFSGLAYELWQDQPKKAEYRLSNPDYIQPNLAVLSEHHVHGKDLI